MGPKVNAVTARGTGRSGRRRCGCSQGHRWTAAFAAGTRHLMQSERLMPSAQQVPFRESANTSFTAVHRHVCTRLCTARLLVKAKKDQQNAPQKELFHDPRTHPCAGISRCSVGREVDARLAMREARTRHRKGRAASGGRQSLVPFGHRPK